MQLLNLSCLLARSGQRPALDASTGFFGRESTLSYNLAYSSRRAYKPHCEKRTAVILTLFAQPNKNSGIQTHTSSSSDIARPRRPRRPRVCVREGARARERESDIESVPRTRRLLVPARERERQKHRQTPTDTLATATLAARVRGGTAADRAGVAAAIMLQNTDARRAMSSRSCVRRRRRSASPHWNTMASPRLVALACIALVWSVFATTAAGAFVCLVCAICTCLELYQVREACSRCVGMGTDRLTEYMCVCA